MFLFSGGVKGTSAKLRKKSPISSSFSTSSSIFILNLIYGYSRWQAERVDPRPLSEQESMFCNPKQRWRRWTAIWGKVLDVRSKLIVESESKTMKLHQVLTGAANTFDDKAAISVGSVDDHPFTVLCIQLLSLIYNKTNNIFFLGKRNLLHFLNMSTSRVYVLSCLFFAFCLLPMRYAFLLFWLC